MPERRPVVRLADYTPPPYTVKTVDLVFDVGPDDVVVSARLSICGASDVVRLDGRDLVLEAIQVDDVKLSPDRYTFDGIDLVLSAVPDTFTLETVVRIDPASNTALEGLYQSGANLYTQCEAEGFRRITFFPDRPDVLSVFTVTVEADKAAYPALLSNGNRVKTEDLPNGRQRVVWHDPFPKPSYLFALVAGDLAHVADIYTTGSGRRVDLHFWTDHGVEDQIGHALDCLKRSMQWDEDTFGLEYDLDVYNVVAVGDFNMGAMENKSLNIFNTSCVLAKADTATDGDFAAVESVIAHEYFHNWSGNRVTCRDWFQLSLKEGLTVYRDQEFSADMGSRGVSRIGNVRGLRAMQFPEDAGPMAHPIRPDSYEEINNFYTTTVYEKGAEVVRMYETLLGKHGFRRGMELYFQRHDGQAVTCDDFRLAMGEANGVDLTEFGAWYGQAGTPRVQAAGHYDAAKQTYTLTLRQHTPPTPGQSSKRPLVIPVAVGLLGEDGADMSTRLAGERTPTAGTRVLKLTEDEARFTFVDVPARPVPSLLRDFSAPVRLETDLSEDDLLFLAGRDTDPFNRWEAGQTLAMRYLLDIVAGKREGLEPRLIAAFAETLEEPKADAAFVALALTLPSEGVIADHMDMVDPIAIHRAREGARRQIGRALAQALRVARGACRIEREYRFAPADVGKRALANAALSYLIAGGDTQALAAAEAQYRAADNMTDRMAALTTLVHIGAPAAEALLVDFYERWSDMALVVDKWFSVQATAPVGKALSRVRGLMAHPAFTLHNPNKVRALIGAFARGNPSAFHATDGSGYRFLADVVIELDGLNPQIAARLTGPLTAWRRYDPPRQAKMRAELERIQTNPRLSANTAEIVGKSLAAE